MYGVNDLKERIVITDDKVECPVRGCEVVVHRQRRGDRREQAKFKCSTHQIYISPTTFEYENFRSNILWRDDEDMALLEKIFRAKRESRMASDSSEDAVTWN